MDDDARRKILARRAAFVAAALAGLGAACGKTNKGSPLIEFGPEATSEPQPCLKQLPRDDYADGGRPQPCLSQPMPKKKDGGQ